MTPTRRHRYRRRRAELYAEALRERAADDQNGRDSGEHRALPFELLAETPSAAVPAPSATPNADLLLHAAQEAALRGESGRAISIFRELLGSAPNNIAARNLLARALSRAGQRETALEELTACLDRDPDHTQTLVSRGAVLGELCQFGEAEADLRRALQNDPGNAEAHLNLGIVTSRRGLWRDAIPHLRRAVELDTGSAGAYCRLGEALNHVDDLDGALHAFQRSAELRPTYPKALRGLGIVFDRLNRPDEAAQMYRRSRELAGT